MNEFISENWEKISIAYLILVKILTGIRDILDKTPESDDNWFEKIVTVATKLGAYLILGKRPS